MNTSMFSALLTLAAAPVIDAPLAIQVTNRGRAQVASVRACDDFARKGRQTLAAHNAPVPVVGASQETAPSRCCPACHWEVPCMCGILDNA